MDNQISEKIANMPSKYRKTYQKATEGNSRKFAIHSMCLECQQWQREEVRQCNDTLCPLHPYKPYNEST